MTKTKRLLSLLLAVAMAFSLFATTACAAETKAPEENETQAQTTDVAAIVETIAAEYAGTEYPGDWQCFDMAAYTAWKKKTAAENFPTLNAAAYSAYQSDAYSAVTRDGATVTDIAKAEVILNSLGLDSSALASGENPAVNNREKISAVSEYQTYSDAIWMLFAGGQGTVELSETQVKKAIDVIAENINEGGLLFGSYGGYTYTDIDSTGWAVAALSPIYRDEEDAYGEKERAGELIGEMLTALSSNQQENGSFGNTYTDASVICGLCGHGIDPATDARFVKGENSLVDGLMSYLNAEKTGFSSGYSPDTDSWATEQAFRALVAYSAFCENKDEPYNIFTHAAKEDGEPEEEPEDKPEEDETEEETPSSKPTQGGLKGDGGKVPDSSEKEETEPAEKKENLITVSFQMNTHKKTWIGRYSVEIEKGSTVADLISRVFAEKGARGDGVNSGYLRSVTYKGETLAEFDVGKGSGWCYCVNGESPMVGISSYKLSDGDSVLLKYVADYDETEETKGSSESDKKTEEAPEKNEEEEKTTVASAFADLGTHPWAEKSINSLAEKGIIKGTGADTFSPGNKITRADFAILLVRAFEKTSDNAENFSDVSENDYFANELAIARNTGLVGGIGDNKFAPRSFIKRCDMMLMVYRVLTSVGAIHELPENVPEYEDFDSVPDYAKDAVSALLGAGLVNGKGNLIAPLDNTTRAEVAVLLERVLELTK